MKGNDVRKALQLTISLVFMVLFTGIIKAADNDQRPVFRQPDIHGDKVVFVSGGDIWSAPDAGGEATRLTLDDGNESHPSFSPDGKYIAFTGQLDGNSDVYVMKADGSDIKRLTFHPSYDEVLGWHPTRQKVLFSSTRMPENSILTTRLYTIDMKGGFPELMILIEAAQASFSPDGKKIVFNKSSRERRTWKRYKGGRAQDVFIYDLENDNEEQITDFEGTDRLPMWIGDKIFYTSDKSGQLNIYSYDTQTQATKQWTEHDDFDARFPGAGKEKIAYEHGGDVYALDLNNGETGMIDISVNPDALTARTRYIKVKDMIREIGVSPGGERAVIQARGELFSVPKNEGVTRNLTQSSGAREQYPAWSPNGDRIAFLSDKNGEYQLYLVDKKGREEAMKLTKFKDGYRHTLRWSPDGTKIAFTDQELRLYFIDVDSKKITEVDKAYYESVDVPLDEKPIYDFKWSHGSKFLTYSKMTKKQVFDVFVYSLEADKTYNVSNSLFHDFHPVFTRDGKHLLFVSNRKFNPTFDDLEWEMVYKDMAGIFSLTLKKNGEALLPHQNDEVGGEKKANSGGRKVSIDFDGLKYRIERLPLDAGNYRYLSVNDDMVFYLTKDDGDFNRFEYREVSAMNLHAFDLKDRKAHKVIEGINEYKLSASGSAIVYKKGKSVGIISSGARESSGHELNLSALEMKQHPREEWRQIFNEAWRMERDFYYESGMHGLDWKDMKKKYAPLIERATTREDVGYIIGELIGELNTSHTYVYGGDEKRNSDRVSVGMLGADYEVDEKADRYKFKQILRDVEWNNGEIPPLDMPGMNIKEGDYLMAVNGTEITTDKNLFSYFQGMSGEKLEITVNSEPDMEGARDILVKTTGRERGLRYINWVEWNRKKVEEASGGKIGYIHFPDTYMGSATHFPRYYYGQMRKEGLIIDGRFNRGGLDPHIFLHRLNTKPLAYFTRRYSHDQTIPPHTNTAHKVCLTNKYAGSGGDMLPFEFRELGMGPVIGTTTWGGLVGVSMFLQMVDGGGLTAPDYRVYSKTGEWIIENEGVAPDIRVSLGSEEMNKGHDAQLMKGVEVLMEKIKNEPQPWPEHKPFIDDNSR